LLAEEVDPTTRELDPASVNQARLSALAEVPTALLALEVQRGGMPGVPGRVMAARSVS
jgi:hypothetical protein